MKFVLILLSLCFSSKLATENDYVAVCVKKNGEVLLIKTSAKRDGSFSEADSKDNSNEYSLPEIRQNEGGAFRGISKILHRYGIVGKIDRNILRTPAFNHRHFSGTNFHMVYFRKFLSYDGPSERVFRPVKDAVELLRHHPNEDYKLFWKFVFKNPWELHLVKRDGIFVKADPAPHIYVCLDEKESVMLLSKNIPDSKAATAEIVSTSSSTTPFRYSFPELVWEYEEMTIGKILKFLEGYGVKGKVGVTWLYTSRNDRMMANRSHFHLVRIKKLLNYNADDYVRLMKKLPEVGQLLQNHPNQDYKLFMDYILSNRRQFRAALHKIEPPSSKKIIIFSNPKFKCVTFEKNWRGYGTISRNTIMKFYSHPPEMLKFRNGSNFFPTVFMKKITLLISDALDNVFFVMKPNGEYILPTDEKRYGSRPLRSTIHLANHCMNRYGIVGRIHKRINLPNNEEGISETVFHILFQKQMKYGMVYQIGKPIEIRYECHERRFFYPDKARYYLKGSVYLPILEEIYSTSAHRKGEYSILDKKYENSFARSSTTLRETDRRFINENDEVENDGSESEDDDSICTLEILC